MGFHCSSIHVNIRLRSRLSIVSSPGPFPVFQLRDMHVNVYYALFSASAQLTVLGAF